MSTTWSWVSTRVEREALKLLLTHLGLILEVGKSALNFFKCFKDDDQACISKSFNNIFNYEREADDIKKKILGELSKGFIHPVDRDEIMKLTLTIDDIAAYIKAATRRATLVDSRSIDHEIKIYSLIMTEKIVQAINLLIEAVNNLHSNPVKSLNIANDVERIEEEVDDIRLRALDRVLKFCKHSDISSCIVSKEIIDSLENSCDRCEDSADVIRIIAVMRV